MAGLLKEGEQDARPWCERAKVRTSKKQCSSQRHVAHARRRDIVPFEFEEEGLEIARGKADFAVEREEVSP